MKTFLSIAQPLIIGVALAIAARSAVRFYSIPSGSMEPTLRAGDHILVTPYHSAVPQRGDIVVFHSPENPNELLVKRIVAVAGDLVESRDGHLIICGHAVTEPYLMPQATTTAITPQIVPADSYFVLGDNRADSLDSRAWGVLPRSCIIGRARLVLWSSGGSTITPPVNAAPLNAHDPEVPAFPFSRLFRPIH